MSCCRAKPAAKAASSSSAGSRCTRTGDPRLTSFFFFSSVPRSTCLCPFVPFVRCFCTALEASGVVQRAHAGSAVVPAAAHFHTINSAAAADPATHADRLQSDTVATRPAALVHSCSINHDGPAINVSHIQTRACRGTAVWQAERAEPRSGSCSPA